MSTFRTDSLTGGARVLEGWLFAFSSLALVVWARGFEHCSDAIEGCGQLVIPRARVRLRSLGLAGIAGLGLTL